MPRALNVCTIIAKNYIAHARVLAQSLRAVDSQARCWTLIIDEFDGHVDPSQEPFDVLTPADIGCEPFEEMATRYSVLELSTAVKPWLLRHLLHTMAAPVTYLDPDIKVYRPLTRLDDLAAEHGVVLTPHNREPIPFDGRRPSQVDIMIAGVYNLGYVSLAPGEEVDHLLDWWGERLIKDCRVDPVWGYFVDQRWFDLVPGFLSAFAIVREPEYNVAYWNLHSRRLEHDGEGYLVDGRPLAFFHFSGFDPRHPLVLSRHQNRIDVGEHAVLEQVLAEYSRDVIAAGHDSARSWSYSFDTLADGTTVDEAMRILYDAFAAEHRAAPSPFTPEGAAQFARWRAERPDDRGPVARRGPDEAPLLEEPWGVNVVGYFRSELGTGAAARQVVRALESRDVPALAVHGQTVPLSRQGHAYRTVTPDEAAYPVNLICMNADALPEFAEQAGPGFFSGRYSIGLWFWEISRFPERFREAFGLLEEVWAPTAHIADALAPLATVPVHTVRIPVHPPRPSTIARAQLGLPDDLFLFLFSFDYLSVFRRKNPLAVIAAFRRAFDGRGRQVGLVMKCINQDRDPDAHAQLLDAIDGDQAIQLIDRYLEPEENVALSALCDCYVSLHRAEGFGLGMAEAMWHAKPVIATGYSGNLDFMTASNSLLVNYELVSVGPGAEPYPVDAEWAEPDIEHAASRMREVLDDPGRSSELGARAAADIRRTHSPAAAGEIMYRRLEAIRGTWNPRAAPFRARRPASRPLAELANNVHRGPSPKANHPGVVRQRLRDVLLKAIRPFSAYQQSVNEDVIAVLTELSDQSAEHRRQMLAEITRLRAELRAADALRGLPDELAEQRQRLEALEARLGRQAAR